MSLILKTGQWTLPLLLIGSPSQAAEDDNETPKQAAHEYRIVLDKLKTVQINLGEDYDKQITEKPEQPKLISNNRRQELINELGPIFVDLKALEHQPQVDWGITQQLAEFGPATDLSYLTQVRGITKAATWYAREVADDPVTASEAIISAMTLARHANQEPTLVSHISKIACEGIGIDNLASLANQMTREQRDELRTRVDQLPTSASFADVIEAERDYVVNYFQRTLNDAIKQWEEKQLDTDGLHFPDGLRLAGIALLPDKPARISLHNTQADTSFWLELGKASNDIELIKVDRHAECAWIRKDTRIAVIDLKRSTIKSSSVPIEVLYDIFIAPYSGAANTTQEEKLEALSELGINPETIFEELETIGVYYAEMLEKINLAPEAFEEWETSRLNEIKPGTLAHTMLPQYQSIIKATHQNEIKMRTFNDGLNLLNLNGSEEINDGAFSVNESNYQIQKTTSGFRLIPEESIGNETQAAVVTFGRDN